MEDDFSSSIFAIFMACYAAFRGVLRNLLRKSVGHNFHTNYLHLNYPFNRLRGAYYHAVGFFNVCKALYI
jgi:hypothetical protein